MQGSYYLHIMSNIQGIDINKLEKKVMRSGAYTTLVPAVRERLRLSSQGPRSAMEWIRARDVCQDREALKFTLPGPMTLMDGVVNLAYEKETDLAKDLVACINQEVLELARVGCKYIQIDEPVMMRYPDKALAYGLDNLAECFAGVPEDVVKVTTVHIWRREMCPSQVIHLCCGYPDKLDTDEYLKAPKTNYNLLAPKIDALGFDEVSIEDCEARNDLSLLSLFKQTKVSVRELTKSNAV